MASGMRRGKMECKSDDWRGNMMTMMMSMSGRRPQRRRRRRRRRSLSQRPVKVVAVAGAVVVVLVLWLPGHWLDRQLANFAHCNAATCT